MINSSIYFDKYCSHLTIRADIALYIEHPTVLSEFTHYKRSRRSAETEVHYHVNINTPLFCFNQNKPAKILMSPHGTPNSSLLRDIIPSHFVTKTLYESLFFIWKTCKPPSPTGHICLNFIPLRIVAEDNLNCS